MKMVESASTVQVEEQVENKSSELSTTDKQVNLSSPPSPSSSMLMPSASPAPMTLNPHSVGEKDNDKTHSSSTSSSSPSSSPPSTREENLAVVLNGIKDLQLKVVSQPPSPPAPGNVNIQITRVGICGADVNYYARGYCSTNKIDGPLILGHECAGKVIEVGEEVIHLKVGDRVAIEPGIPCRYCDLYCKGGRYNLCPEMKFMATPPVDGALVRYLSFPAGNCFKLPDDMTDEEGALIEPLALSVHGVNRADIKVASTVLITGAGPIGLCTMLVAKASGATTIVMVDRVQERLNIAKELGADIILNADIPDLENQLKNMKISHVIECSGANQLGLALKVTRRGGKVVMLGRPIESELKLPLQDGVDNEVDLIGAYRYHGNYPAAMELIAKGKVPVARLISHRFGLEESKKAFDMALDSPSSCIKIMIVVSD